jgi:hypothetical protein
MKLFGSAADRFIDQVDNTLLKIIVFLRNLLFYQVAALLCVTPSSLGVHKAAILVFVV